MWWNGASYDEFDAESMETETITWSELDNGGKIIVEQILASEKRNKSKRAKRRESQSWILVGKLTIWVRSPGYKNYNKVHKSISSTRIA